MNHSIEIVSVHYKTPDLIYEQYKSVRKLYPTIPYRIIDGSDDSQVYFVDLENQDPNFKVERFGYNIHHGPGMDYAIRSSSYDFLLIIDSDVTLKKELIDDMMRKYNGYAVGKKIIVNKSGHEKGQHKWWKLRKNFIYPYIHPYCMMINRNAYLQFHPFKKHGAPCIDAMIDIFNRKQTELLGEINIEAYVDLKIRGTRSQWGMNL